MEISFISWRLLLEVGACVHSSFQISDPVCCRPYPSACLFNHFTFFRKQLYQSISPLFFTAKLYLFCNINLTVFILYKNVYLKHLWKHHKNQILTCIIVLILVILTQMKAGLEEGSHMRKDALGPKSFISYKRFSHTIKRKPYHPLFL